MGNFSYSPLSSSMRYESSLVLTPSCRRVRPGGLALADGTVWGSSSKCPYRVTFGALWAVLGSLAKYLPRIPAKISVTCMVEIAPTVQCLYHTCWGIGTCTPSCWERQRFYRFGGSCAVLMHIHGSTHETCTSWYIYSFMPWHAWWIYPHTYLGT